MLVYSAPVYEWHTGQPFCRPAPKAPPATCFLDSIAFTTLYSIRGVSTALCSVRNVDNICFVASDVFLRNALCSVRIVLQTSASASSLQRARFQTCSAVGQAGRRGRDKEEKGEGREQITRSAIAPLELFSLTSREGTRIRVL